MPISEIQKKIYNHYLKAYRVNNGKPFRAKKDFSDIENNEEILGYLKKLESTFLQNPSFLSDDFFNAPYKIYNEDKKFYNLKFYSSYKGLSTCIAYYKTFLQKNPEEQFEYFKDSYRFIVNFCLEKQMTLNFYTKYKTISQFDCLKHLKDYKISWYIVFSFPGFREVIINLPKDEFELYFGSDIDIKELYMKYKASKKTQEFLDTLYKEMKKYVEIQLKKP